MDTVEKIITDTELEGVFENTRFGDTPKRELIAEALLKVVSGYANGHTMECIISELGLTTQKKTLTKKGTLYFREAFYDKVKNAFDSANRVVELEKEKKANWDLFMEAKKMLERTEKESCDQFLKLDITKNALKEIMVLSDNPLVLRLAADVLNKIKSK